MKKLCAVAATMTILVSTLAVGSAQAAASPVGAAGAAPPAAAAYGRTVDAATGRPVPFVVVIAYEEDYSTVISAAISNRRGRFLVRGLTDEEFALRYLGGITRHESGWQACDGSVVPTSGEACTQGPGFLGRIRLDRL